MTSLITTTIICGADYYRYCKCPATRADVLNVATLDPDAR